MARTYVVTDDVDGSQGAKTIEFSYRGQRYEIDLAEKNEKKFDDAMSSWVGHARKVGGAGRPAGSGSRAGQKGKRDPEQLNAIREWARANGYEVSDRGRIKAEIEEAYNAAN